MNPNFYISYCILLLVGLVNADDVAESNELPIPVNGPHTIEQGNVASTSSSHTQGNESDTSSFIANTTTTPQDSVLPAAGSEEQEHKSSMAIFFILFVIVLSILLVHIIIVFKLHYIPESLAIVVLGSVIGFVLSYSDRDWTAEESFRPNAFFLILLPPIIFEGGYNLHKGNFFSNIGSILVFAIFGTFISGLVVGGGIFILGQADLIYELAPVESFAFGSMISAVDPVATLAIFQAIDVDPMLYMLVFGESMLNDAVAIVLTTTFLELNEPGFKNTSLVGSVAAFSGRFCIMFFVSAAIGIILGLISALLLKHIDLRRTPSLEFAVMLIFAYLPYGLAEGLELSGIMAILFCGIAMSHYTHLNLSPVTQIMMQQTCRTLAFISETCVFAYLGMAFFTFPLIFKPVFIIWGIILCLLGRALNIFPLSMFCNYFREHQISKKTQFIMWFSGLRGAIAFALSLHMKFESPEMRRVVVSSTLIIVLFTMMCLGGGTLPLLKLLNRWKLDDPVPTRKPSRRRRSRKRKRSRQRKSNHYYISKTQEMGQTLEADYSYSEYVTEGEDRAPSRSQSPTSQNIHATALTGLARIDARYFRPFFVRKFTHQEKKESTMKLTALALQWYRTAQQESDEEDNDSSTLFDITSPASSTLISTTPTATPVISSTDIHLNNSNQLHNSQVDDKVPLIEDSL